MSQRACTVPANSLEPPGPGGAPGVRPSQRYLLALLGQQRSSGDQILQDHRRPTSNPISLEHSPVRCNLGPNVSTALGGLSDLSGPRSWTWANQPSG